MYVVTQKNSDGRIINRATSPMTCLQAFNWIDKVKIELLSYDYRYRGTNMPEKDIIRKFWVRPETKEEILHAMISETPLMYQGDVFNWYQQFAKDFDEFWEDYV